MTIPVNMMIPHPRREPRGRPPFRSIPLLTLSLFLLAWTSVFAQLEEPTGSDTTRASGEDGALKVEVGRAVRPIRSTFGASPPNTISPTSKWADLYSSGGAVMIPSTLGATVGGAQDIGYARKLIEEGRVPSFIDFSPEGLYSEHDIPTPAADCDETLCLSLGYGFAPAADTKKPALFVQLGMTSGIRPDEFHRPPLQLALVVDVSGSMDDGKLEAVRQALRKLAARLNAHDVVSIVAFDEEAEIALPPVSAEHMEDILAAIDGLAAGGGTNIELGLTNGFRLIDSLPSRPGHQKRVMLFTDARPNIGRSDSGSFAALTQAYADRKIGLTVFGVGLDFGQQLIYHISQLRGGNFFFLESPEKIAHVFDDEFDFLVTPIVYDLDVRVATPKGLKLTAVYGLPSWKPDDRDAELHIPTVFFSSNRGAIVLRYERDEDVPFTVASGATIADGSISYTDVDGTSVRNAVQLKHRDKATLKPGMQFYTHDGMRTAVALTNLFFGLRDACLAYTKGEREEALDAIARATALVRLENLTLSDEGLANEVAMLEQLKTNIEASETAPDAFKTLGAKGKGGR